MDLQLKLKKKKKKEKQENKQDSSAAQRLAVRAVQKQVQLLNLKEVLLLIGFTIGAALLRIPMQVVPSAEPLTFFAILAGWLFGRSRGFAVGASSLFISNFFMFGGQGPWTIIQVLGFGIAGWLGGLLRKKASYLEVMAVVVMSTLVFEIIMNAFTPLMVGTSIFITFALALPFMAMHLVSNLIFSLGLPSAKKFVEEKGGFNEKEICVNILNKYNIGNKLNWFKRFGRKEKLSR
jgi:energy-coupling factor transport system substrate-specific component